MRYKKIQQQYRIFSKRIDTIIKTFDFKPNINGPTRRQSDKIRAIIVLCHAEIEDYIEYLATEIIENAEKRWIKKIIANQNLSALFIYSNIEKKDSFITKSRQIISDFKKSIKNNHGIKENNIEKLFEPLGYSIKDFDTSFMAILNSFGTLRGEIAHQSIRKTQTQLDKKTEVERIQAIVKEIDVFQKELWNKVN